MTQTFDLECHKAMKTSVNPFFDDSDEDEEDELLKEKEIVTESDIEEVENPIDRVVSSSGTFSPTKVNNIER